LAADMKVVVPTDELVKMLGLPASLAKPVNAKWSFPLGQPLSQ